MFKVFVILLASFFLFFFSDRSPINYQPKSLYREVENKWGISEIVSREILLSDSVIECNRLEGKYFEIIDTKDTSHNYFVYIGRVNSCRAGGCSISNTASEDLSSEYFDYFILFSPYCDVELVRVYNYQATHGQEVSVKGWLKQFIGYNGSQSLEVGKNIDAIAGATISVYAITIDVELKTRLLRQINKN